MASRWKYDPGTQQNWEMQPSAVVRAVAPLRNGLQGELRHAVRCLLLQAMGFECANVPLNAKIPHQFPDSRFTDEDKYGFVQAAHDGLRELGYDAAADILSERAGRRLGVADSVAAKCALENLEAGPPSVTIGPYALYTYTLKKFRDRNGLAYLVGRAVNDPRWWYRFAVGVRTRDRWDPEGGYTFQRRGRTLSDVLSSKYGSAKLEAV